jgi:hypothetical protein
MTENQTKKTTQSSNQISPVIAGIAGAVAGGMAVAAAIVMSDQKNQKKVKDAADGVKEKVTGYVNAVKSQPAVAGVTQKAEKIAEVIRK